MLRFYDRIAFRLVTAKGFEKWGVGGDRQPYITGAGLGGRYDLIGFHFHWGTHDNVGSEHTLNGLHYPLEAHFVHKKSNRESISQSKSQSESAAEDESEGDELAVVGVWYYIDNNDGRPLRQLERAYISTDSYGIVVVCNCPARRD
uniref:Carbonic anhydrase n=1 Tax=Plectus sambesii TaxID=2011161 RepID=A0A914W530_9BILA